MSFSEEFSIYYDNGYNILERINDNDIIDLIIPSGIHKLSDYCLFGCYNIKHIYISDTVIEIPSIIFETCVFLESIEVDKNNKNFVMKDNCLIDLRTNSLIKGFSSSKISEDIKTICDGAFFGCVDLKSINIPSSVKVIGEDAFSSCVNLSEVIFNGEISFIGDSAFTRCESLSKISLPNGIKSIGIHTFSFCKSLESIDIPSSVKDIRNDAFYCCTFLNKVNFNEELDSIGDRAFMLCTSLNEVVLNNVKFIGEDAFDSNCNVIKY